MGPARAPILARFRDTRVRCRNNGCGVAAKRWRAGTTDFLDLDRRETARPDKRLFNYSEINGEPEESRHPVLSPYLFDASGLFNPQLTVREESGPINGMGNLITGTQPLEDGNLTFSSKDRAAFLQREPASAPFFRPFPGAREFIRGDERWILHTAGIPPQRLRQHPCANVSQDILPNVSQPSSQGSDKRRFFAVLHLGGIRSPQDAVRAAIVAEKRLSEREK